MYLFYCKHQGWQVCRSSFWVFCQKCTNSSQAFNHSLAVSASLIITLLSTLITVLSRVGKFFSWPSLADPSNLQWGNLTTNSSQYYTFSCPPSQSLQLTSSDGNIMSASNNLVEDSCSWDKSWERPQGYNCTCKQIQFILSINDRMIDDPLNKKETHSILLTVPCRDCLFHPASIATPWK